MDEAGWLKSTSTTTAVLVANFPGTDPIIPFRMAARLRNAGIGAEVYPEPIQIGKQMGYGSSRGHKLAVIVGPDEAAREVFNLRNLSSRQEDKGLSWSVLEDSVQSAPGDHRAGRVGLMNPGRSEPDRQGGPGPLERPIGLVRGTRDWLPGEFAELAELERRLLDQFRRAGYRAMRTPILEFSELHERKSGAGIVANLFEVKGAGTTDVCLRPELTASIVRAYVEAEVAPPLPFRVAMSGPVFRFQTLAQGRDREFTQVGVELLGAGGPAADAEVIWLADWSLAALGIADASIRIGHVGLILELLSRSGLPPAATSALVESLSEAAAEGPERTVDRNCTGAAGRLAARRRRRRRAGHGRRIGRESGSRSPLPPSRARGHGPPLGRRDHRAAPAEVGPRALAPRGS